MGAAGALLWVALGSVALIGCLVMRHYFPQRWQKPGPLMDQLPPPVGVPRRFGVGSLLAVTAAFAVLLGIVRWLAGIWLGETGSAETAAIMAWLIVFFAVVGVSQAVLFGGKKPRLASLLAGAVMGGLSPLVVFLVMRLWLGPLLSIGPTRGASGGGAADGRDGRVCGPRRVRGLPGRCPGRRGIPAHTARLAISRGGPVTLASTSGRSMHSGPPTSRRLPKTTHLIRRRKMANEFRLRTRRV